MTTAEMSVPQPDPARPPIRGLRAGITVLYHANRGAPRAALVVNVLPDGRTADLMVWAEGDGNTSSEVRLQWAQGNVARFRGLISCQADDLSGFRHWTFDDTDGLAELVTRLVARVHYIEQHLGVEVRT